MAEIRRLSKEEKVDVLVKARSLKWEGCMCDDCLEVIASLMLDAQLKLNPLKRDDGYSSDVPDSEPFLI